jgi:hypothetical protein
VAPSRLNRIELVPRDPQLMDVLLNDSFHYNEEREEMKGMEHLYTFLHKLPQVDQEVLNYRYALLRNQKEIARLMGMTQEVVHYVEQQALRRLKMWYYLNTIDLAELEKDLDRCSKVKVRNYRKTTMAMFKDLLLTYFHNPCIYANLKEYCTFFGKKVSQEMVRYRVKSAIKLLREFKSPYYEVFMKIKRYSNFNNPQYRSIICQRKKLKQKDELIANG